MQHVSTTTRPSTSLAARLRIITICLGWIAVTAWKLTGDGYTFIDAVGQAASDWQLLLVIAAADAARQLHYMAAETFGSYHQANQQRWKKLEDRWMRIHPWTRWRIAAWAKRTVVAGVLFAALAAMWNVSYLDAVAQAPQRIWRKLIEPTNALPFVIQIAVILFVSIAQFAMIFWYMARGAGDVLSPGEVHTRFGDVWGQDHVVERLKETLVFLDHPEQIEGRGGYVPGGILLWGPPGTGKTLMAEALAGETGKPYVFVDPGSFQAMFFGVGIMKVKRLFRRLRKLALQHGGVVVFYDEADSLGNRGGGVGGSGRGVMRYTHSRWLSPAGQDAIADSGTGSTDRHDGARGWWRNRVIVNGVGGLGELQALLAEMSGLVKPRGFFNRVIRRFLGLTPRPAPKYRILSIFATNLPDVLDPALMRPGRIDRRYHVGYPNVEGRIRTYRGYLDKTSHTLSDDEITKLATMTPYATGASIKDLVNEAVIHATRNGQELVCWDDILAAKLGRDLGEPDGGEYIQRERHAIAIHEACHAVAAADVRRHLTIDVATIERRGAIGGMVASIPPEDRFTHWNSEYEADLVVSLASVAGEELLFGQHSSGVQGDLRQATELASLMAGEWGMGQNLAHRAVLRQHHGDAGSVRGGGTGDDEKPISASNEVEEILQHAYQRAKDLLERRKDDVLALAHALEEHRTISGDDVHAVLERRKGQKVDGRVYRPETLQVLGEYHAACRDALVENREVEAELPALDTADRDASVSNQSSGTPE